jgi:hypothetical protein
LSILSVDSIFPKTETMSTPAMLEPTSAKATTLEPEEKPNELRSIRKTWTAGNRNEEPDEKNVEQLLKDLVACVKDWMEKDSTVAARKQLAVQLELSFKEKNGQLAGCVLWLLMNLAALEIESKHSTRTQIQRTSSTPNLLIANGESGLTPSDSTAVTDDDANRELVMALVRAFPQLAFDEACPLDHDHRKSKAPAFIFMIDVGSLHFVKYMIKQILDQPPPRNADLQESRTWLVQKLANGNYQKAPITAMVAYVKYRGNDNLEVLKEVLKIDNGKAGVRLVDEDALLLAISKTRLKNWMDNSYFLRSMEMFIKDRDELKTTIVLTRALGTECDGLVKLIFTGANIDESMIKYIITLNRENIWALQPIQEAVAALLADDKIAKQLFSWTLNMLNQPEPGGSAQNQPGPSNVGTNLPRAQSERRRYLEDILKQVGSFDLGFRAEIIKSGMLWFWKTPLVQKLWQEEKEKEKEKAKAEAKHKVENNAQDEGSKTGIYMLHVAVQYQQVDMVKYFLEVEPDSATQQMEFSAFKRGDKGTYVYALWHNNYLVRHCGSNPVCRENEEKGSTNSILANGEADSGWEAGLHSNLSLSASESSISENSQLPGPRQQIRDILVPAIIERASGMGTLARIFRESGGEFQTPN